MDKFDWDEDKNLKNQQKHGVSFEEAQNTFLDSKRIIYEDIDHSTAKEKRYYCVGKLKNKICTVRFTYRQSKLRIFGAGYWRKERRFYEKKRKEK
jgi:uncharacterized DUF497 family protein